MRRRAHPILPVVVLAAVSSLIFPAAGSLAAVPSASVMPRPSGPPTPRASPFVIAGPEEPGTRLRIDGRVTDAATGTPIEGARLVLYHADDGGEYEPTDPTDESTARLRGELASGPDGRFAFRTVLPGEYPGQPIGNRHIHVHSVVADGYQPQGFVILFEDNVRDDVQQWAEDTGFGTIIGLAKRSDTLVGAVEITLEATTEDDLEPSPAS